MKLNIDLSKYAVPVLGICCAGGALLAVSAVRPPVRVVPSAPASRSAEQIPESLRLLETVPPMEEVLAKHLFVPERTATGENAFPDLLVKGVYVGETQRNAVLSLKSKPDANLRVWLGDVAAAVSQVVDERDPRHPIADFLNEWQIKSIDFSGVTFEHIITAEVETYPVDYHPLKQAKSSAVAGYGQGYAPDFSTGSPNPAPTKPAAGSRTPPVRTPAGNTQAIAGRIGQFMQRLSPQQRQQFMQQLQKQNAAANKKGDAKTPTNGRSDNKKTNTRKTSSGKRRR